MIPFLWIWVKLVTCFQTEYGKYNKIYSIMPCKNTVPIWEWTLPSRLWRSKLTCSKEQGHVGKTWGQSSASSEQEPEVLSPTVPKELNVSTNHANLEANSFKWEVRPGLHLDWCLAQDKAMILTHGNFEILKYIVLNL